VGVCFAVPAVVPRGQSAARVRAPGSVRRGALDCQNRLTVAMDAERSAALARGLPADAALARCRRFQLLVEDVRSLLREWAGRKGQPTAVCIDSRTLQSTPESGARRLGTTPRTKTCSGGSRTGRSGAKAARSTSRSIRWTTCSPSRSPLPTRATAQLAALAEQVQHVTGNSVELAYVDQGYTGPAAAAGQHGIRLEVVKHPAVKRGFVLLPRR
jgi:hypothetical protein